MQRLNNQNPVRNNTNNNNKKILIIVAIYLFLTLTSKYSKNNTINMKIRNKIINKAQNITASDIISTFQQQEIFIGKWISSQQQNNQNNFGSNGKFQMKVDYASSFSSTSKYRIQFSIWNGQYIDDGVLDFSFYIDDNNFNSQRKNDTLRYFLNKGNQTQFLAQYRIKNILKNVDSGETDIQQIEFAFSLNDQQQLITNIDVHIRGNLFSLGIAAKESRIFKNIIFAAVLLIVAFCSFTSIMRILKDLYELRDNPSHYSLITVCITCMWDATLCFLSFIYAFSDQEGLMLYIMPAFLFCLLFTNLQPRFMIFIYQQLVNGTIREVLCKFNLFHYGTLLMVYPIIIFTNLSWVLFIGLSLIGFPQIYVNGINGIRPNFSSHYYTRYLLSRLLIILYFKCFPYNIFGLAPNYILTVICLLIIAFQYFLLKVQKDYGAKKVIPSFMLEPVFDYKLDDKFNLQECTTENKECSICLISLLEDPAHDPNELPFEPTFKLMNTPCNHHYHSRCLMVWMKVKMECPQCRSKLPPYE